MFCRDPSGVFIPRWIGTKPTAAEKSQILALILHTMDLTDTNSGARNKHKGQYFIAASFGLACVKEVAYST